MTRQKEPMTIKQLADKIAWRCFGSDHGFKKELEFIMGRNRGKSNDTIREVLEDILNNV